MQTALVPQAIPVDGLSKHETQLQNTKAETLDFIEKEIDMGFFEHHSFEIKNGIVQNNGCQRIKKCTCDCNHCSTALW